MIADANDFQNILDEASVHILKASSSSGPISIGRMVSICLGGGGLIYHTVCLI